MLGMKYNGIMVLVTYRITRHSNERVKPARRENVLVTYRITRHSNICVKSLRLVAVLVTYRITRHSNNE